jgi:hypothetical protein
MKILEFPTEKMFNILYMNNNNYKNFKRSKTFVVDKILNTDITDNEKYDRYENFKKSEYFYDKIHINIRESSPQYVDERISIQFYKEDATNKFNLNKKFKFSTKKIFGNRWSFEVNGKYDYEELIDFLENKIKNKFYFIDLEILFIWILEKKDVFNRNALEYYKN